MTNPISDNSGEKPEDKNNERRASIKAIIVIAIPIGFFIIIIGFWYLPTAFSLKPDPLEHHICLRMMWDAKETISLAGPYMADQIIQPDRDESARIEPPTIEYLKREYGLTLHHYSTVIIDGSLEDYMRVTVLDTHNKCARGDRYEMYWNHDKPAQWYSD